MILENTEISRDALALRILQALETAASDPETRQLLPGDVLQFLREIHNLLLPGDGFPPRGGGG
jgi:hypothetical protein